MRRGFKTEANQIAREVRQELSLSKAAPLDVVDLADHLTVPILRLSDFRDDAPRAAKLFLTEDEALFSAVTVFDGVHKTIVFNDGHAPTRQASDIGHELAHGLLQHTPHVPIDGRGCRFWRGEEEEEANWLSAALLISEEAALSIVRNGWSLAEASRVYGVSMDLIRFRVNVTGARKRIDRWRNRN